MYRKLIFVLTIMLMPTLGFTNNISSTTEALLLQHKDKYPGCVMIVEEQLLSIDPTEHQIVTPILLESCIKGREIGEKRTKKMYDIKKEAKPHKLGGFTIKIEPPRAKDENLWDVHY